MIQSLFPPGGRNDLICYFTHETLDVIKQRNEDLSADFHTSWGWVGGGSVRAESFLEVLEASG